MNAAAHDVRLRPLYSPPPVHRFQRADRERLIETLGEAQSTTSIESPGEPGELMLQTSCTTQIGGYAYTSEGFRQICRLLGPGLSRMIPDLAGTKRRDIPDAFMDHRLAISIFNAIVNLRFPAMASYRLVKNMQTRMIDGVVGNNHRRLANLTFFNAVEDALQNVPLPAEFHAASLLGRRFVGWWRSPHAFLTYPLGQQPWSFTLGYYVRNDEITGASARATLAIFCRAGVCLAPFQTFGAKVKHQGRDFAVRLHGKLNHVATQQLPLDEWRTKIPQALSQSLGLATSDDPKARRRKIARLVGDLNRLGVDAKLARDILDVTLTHGRRVGTPQPELDPVMQSEVFASRTVVDLLPCLLHLARRLDITRREALEQAAFSLLVGKLF